jgi:hypothetical protein
LSKPRFENFYDDEALGLTWRNYLHTPMFAKKRRPLCIWRPGVFWEEDTNIPTSLALAVLLTKFSKRGLERIWPRKSS